MAAMNSFIQELRNLSSTSSASSIDSGFTGDSNAGSGRATANQPTQVGAIWGNKSLWGGPPLSPPAAAKSSQESAVTGSYASKDSTPPPPAPAVNPWATAVIDPSQPQSPSFSPSIWENYTPKAAPTVAAEAASGASSSSTLGSIWMIPEQPERDSVWGESTKLLRPMEVGGSKLSSLWTPNAATPAPVAQAASGSNVLKSLRLAGTVGAGSGASSSLGLGGLTTTPATQQLFSDEFLSYLNINN